MPPRARAPLVVLLALAAAQTTARAQAPGEAHARLVYFVDPMATGCPSPEEFRAAVNARAGHELFGEPSDRTLDVTLRHDTAVYVATVGFPDTPNASAATRELRSEVGCAELASAAALVASIALDPESILRAPPPPPPPPPSAPKSASRSWRALVGLGARGAWGLTPDATVGLALSAAAVSERLALGAEVVGLLPNDASFARGSVSVLPLTLSLLPCGMAAHVELCAIARLGLLRGAGAGFNEDLSTWKAFAAGGVRAGGFADVGRFRLRASIEGTAIAPTTHFNVDETTAYATRGVSVAVGVDALLFF